jgi:monofunctional glycosyltransferase
MRDFGRDLLARPSLRRDFGRRLLFGAAASFAGFVSLCLIFVGLYAFLPVPVTPLVGIRIIEAGFSGRSIHFAKDWIGIDEMAPSLLKAAIASEDFHFAEHRGFDFAAIEKAIKANERAERFGRGRIRGASTITQQTAKNVFLWPGRTWLRKGLEAWMTVLIEATWSKRRILEVYLNVIEFGDGVYGVESASNRFFHKSAKLLTSKEAALLIAVLPNPRKFLVDRPSAYVRFRQASILRRLHDVDVPN